MRFYVNVLSTHFPKLDRSYEVYYQQMLEQVELAEESGFECFIFNDHHFLDYGGVIANPAVMLAAAATRTSRICLGPCIGILRARHPLQVAEIMPWWMRFLVVGWSSESAWVTLP